MNRRAARRWIGVGAIAMTAIHCNDFAASCSEESVAVDVLPTDFPTCGEGFTPTLGPDGGESGSAATAQCQSLCGRFGAYGATGLYACCVSAWVPDTVVCEEVCQD